MEPSASLRLMNGMIPDQIATLEDVYACYREILLREPDDAGLASYQEEISGTILKVHLIQSFLNSDEFNNTDNTSHKVRAQAAFADMLDCFDQSGALLINWFHSMPMPDGSISKGKRPIEVLRREADCIFKMGMEGRSMLDIGAWDGFFSFEAERRGARDILSTDHFCWSGPGWGSKEGYDFTHKTWSSKARSQDVDVFSLDPQDQGSFDVVLFLGVLYHLKDPYGGLERAAKMTKDLLVVETVTDCNHTKVPVMRHYLNTELDKDPTNFFAPNIACLESMLREMGFETIEAKRNPGLEVNQDSLRKAGGVFDRDRHIVHAWRGKPS